MKQRTLLFLFAMLSALTASAQKTLIDGIYYNLDAGKKQATVTSGSSEYVGSVIIPESFTYDGVIYSVISIEDKAFRNCSGLTSVSIPNSVTSIGSSAFSWCTGLTSITIPNSVTSIGGSAFYGCLGITKVTIPNSVTEINNYAFTRCSSLTSVTIPNSVKRIGSWSFWDCSSLTSIEIPNSVTSIGKGAFSGCYFEIKEFINNSILDAEANNYWGATILDSRENGFAIKDGLLIKYYGNESVITIPNSVTSIGSSAFINCSDLTSVTIPNSVTSIGDQAFSGCKGLTSVTIPNSVTSIGQSAFYGCFFEKGEFINKSSLDAEANNNWGAVIVDSKENGFMIKDGVLVAYFGNESVITIPNSVTSIGQSAFAGCSGLTSVTIPNSVTSIGGGAFYGCSNLSSITIPNSVTSIGDYAFGSCSGLTSVTCEATSVPSTGDYAFADVPQSSATLYVPASALEDYKATSPWSDFGTVVAIPDGGMRGDVNGDGIVNGTDIQAIINAIVEGEYDKKADVNEDEQVNGTDIQEVINIIVNAD